MNYFSNGYISSYHAFRTHVNWQNEKRFFIWEFWCEGLLEIYRMPQFASENSEFKAAGNRGGRQAVVKNTRSDDFLFMISNNVKLSWLPGGFRK